MNADEYERELRDAVTETVMGFISAGIYQPLIFEEALTAYADWLRLRAVAEQRCEGQHWQKTTTATQPHSCPDDAPCPAEEASRKIDEILAAEGGTG